MFANCQRWSRWLSQRSSILGQFHRVLHPPLPHGRSSELNWREATPVEQSPGKHQSQSSVSALYSLDMLESILLTFLIQCAAGCYLVIGISDMRRSGWRYLRLMAIVAAAFAFGGLLLFAKSAALDMATLLSSTGIALMLLLVSGLAWLFVNAGQQENVTRLQRIVALAAATVGVAALVLLERDAAPATSMAVIISSLLGAALLGACTCGMLLGHRYLTDTQMPIAPLRRLTQIYLTVFAVRTAWALANTLPVWMTDFYPKESPLFFQIVLYTRLGVGLAVAAVFAYMIWDCVRRRATQSATAMFYLSMVLIFFGELAAQFLMRTEGLAV